MERRQWLIVRLLQRLAGLFAKYFKWMLLLGIFAFKFLEWWYESANKLNPARTLPVPPPPPICRPSRTGIPLTSATTHLSCPLCSRAQRSNPACTPSGYVFCYLCIFKFVQEHRRCPITNMPCTDDQIRKVYQQ